VNQNVEEVYPEGDITPEGPVGQITGTPKTDPALTERPHHLVPGLPVPGSPVGSEPVPGARPRMVSPLRNEAADLSLTQLAKTPTRTGGWPSEVPKVHLIDHAPGGL
jgi:hypothetical protein